MRGHVVKSLLLGSVAALLLAVGPVAAKIPYFSIEVSPADPVDGDVVVIVVRMWDDAQHTQPATWSPGPTVGGLVEVRGSGGRVPVTLVRLDDVTYRAEVTLSAGTWQVVPFPDLVDGMPNGAAGDYPLPITVTVGSLAADSPSSAALGIAAGGALGIVAVALLVGGPLRRRMQRRRTVAR
jgi:hypothetical protein